MSLNMNLKISNKRTAAEVKKAWKEVEAHERELKRQQEMYRSMLTEYYSALESRKAIEIHSMKMGADFKEQSIIDTVSQINLGLDVKPKTHKNSGLNKTPSKLQSAYHHNSMQTNRVSKASNKFPNISITGKSNSKMMTTTLNFSPSIRNHSEMRQTMKGILSTEEKQYQVLRKFVKYSPKNSKSGKNSFKRHTEFR